MREKVTVPAIQIRKCRPTIKFVTAYDAPSARSADSKQAMKLLTISKVERHVKLPIYVS
jgi:hypothetical protein